MSDDRGQLILIGAIAIALIIVGVVLVVNTALFTEVVGSEGTVETAKESGVAGEELSDSVSAAVHEVNLDGSASDTVISSTVDNLRPRLLNNSLDGRGAYVSVDYNGRTQTGTRVAQTDYSEFTDADGNSDWVPVPDGDIGGFVMTINVSDSSSTSDFQIYAHGDAGSPGAINRSLDIDIDDSAGELTLSTPDTSCGPIEATDDTVRIDVTNGRVYEDPSCTFDLFGPPEPNYRMTFLNADQAYGTYAFVTSGSGPSSTSTSSADDEPTATSAVWAYTLGYTYDTGDVVTEGEREVRVYD